MDRLCDWVIAQKPIEDIFRALCLMSLTKQGLEENLYEFARKEITESYGFEKMQVFSGLEACGFIRKREKKSGKDEASSFSFLKLFQSKETGSHSTDFRSSTHPYDNYYPLTSKILQMAVKDSWQDQLIFGLPGPMETYGDLFRISTPSKEKKTVLYYMVGGLTYSEVAYLRILAIQLNLDLLIATTDIITSKDLLKPVLSSQKLN